MSDLLDNLARWAIEVVYAFGYLGVAFLTALAHLHVPIPTPLFLPLAGFLVSQGRFSFLPVLVASTAGAVAASLVLYVIGLWIGEESLRRLIKWTERFKLGSGSHLEKATKVFEQHGGKAIVISHLIPGIGALIAIPAGLKRMPILGRFTACTILGSGVWNAAFIGLGWVLGDQWTLVEQNASIVEYVVLGTAIAVGILWYLRRQRKAHRGE